MLHTKVLEKRVQYVQGDLDLKRDPPSIDRYNPKKPESAKKPI